MKLSELFNVDSDLEIKGISTDSRKVKEGDLFLCIKGIGADRHDYLELARDKGAVAAVISKDVEVEGLYLHKVADVDAITNDILRKFYDNPQEDIAIIGITGTDGKTSISTIVQHLIGEKCAYIGTNGVNCTGYEASEVHNTTPSYEYLLKYLCEFRSRGCKYLALEASSEGFYYDRLKDVEFKIAAVSNVHEEHLNTHKTLENYIDCKKQLFRQNRGISILNKDDRYFEEFAKECQKYVSYGYDSECDLQIVSYKLHSDCSEIHIKYKSEEYQFKSPLLGKFNVENVACAFLICINVGIDIETLIERLKDVRIAGRMEVIDSKQDFSVIVDYAHTVNGMQQLFNFVKNLSHHHIIAVAGKAGERDVSQRAACGEILARNSDYVYFTAEDPRFEPVTNTYQDLITNIKDLDNYELVEDRGSAIAKAINNAQRGDIVLILGKGAEKSMEIEGKEIPFCDVDHAGAILAELVNFQSKFLPK